MRGEQCVRNIMAEKIFVLGSNSFSGASFVAYALEQEANVFGVSRSPEPHSAFLPYQWQPAAPWTRNFRFAQFDLNKDIGSIAEAIETFRPDYVVNFAAQSMVAESWLHPEDWYQTNVLANVRLHEKIRKFDCIKRYVHISTPEVYGSCCGNVTETAPFNPSTPYAASRAACDLHLMTFFRNYRFPVVFTRAANVFGPGQQLYRIIPRTILFIKLGRKIQLHGGGRSVRSFIHIRDVADGTLRAARHAPLGEAYHFSTSRVVSIRELVGMICRRLGVDFEASVEVVGERLGKDAAYLLDSTKARSTLGWQDRFSLEQGIDETVAWISRNLEVLRQQPFDYIHKP
jgi:dTDP-glucose 4,6-dehydratase